MKPEIVPATPEIVEAYYGKRPARTFRGYAALLDGKPVGLAGIYDDGGYRTVFGDIAPELRPYRKTLARGVQIVRDLMAEQKAPIYAVESPDEPTAPALLAKLGFVPTGREVDDGKIMVRPR